MQHLNWNVHMGGYRAYDLAIPANDVARGNLIQQALNDFRMKDGVTSATFTDAHRWDEAYGQDGDIGAGIAAYTGFKQAFFTRVNDERLNRDDGVAIGVAYATDEKVATSGILDMSSRLGLKTVLDIGGHGLQIASMYLEDQDPGKREQQFRAGLADLEPDVPTLINGDNLLRSDMQGAALRHRMGHIAARSAIYLLPWASRLPVGAGMRDKLRYFDTSLGGMCQDRLNVLAAEHDFNDSDPYRRPTMPAKFPLLGLDFTMHNNGLEIIDFQVPTSPLLRGASDHLATIATIGLAAYGGMQN